MANLGNMYRDGRGVSKDPSEARKWLEKSAATGQVYAMNSLGKMYQDGLGVPKDATQARKWYEMAASTGDESAKASLKQLGNR
jgi:TPR repeat protein